MGRKRCPGSTPALINNFGISRPSPLQLAGIARWRPSARSRRGVQDLASLLNMAVPKLEPAAYDGVPAGEGGESLSKKTIDDLIRERPELFDDFDARPPSESNYWPDPEDVSDVVRE